LANEVFVFGLFILGDGRAVVGFPNVAPQILEPLTAKLLP
jgi:hypothetical protein